MTGRSRSSARRKGAWLLAGWLLVLWAPGPARSETRIARGAEVQALPEDVKELMAAFEQMDRAIRAKNLDALMGFYAGNYAHLGARRDDMRAVWATLFQEYRELTSAHTFTRIHIQRGKHLASVQCSGSMFGLRGDTGEKEPVDHWIEEIHYLVYEDGRWKIFGHEVETHEPRRFGVAFHPLF